MVEAKKPNAPMSEVGVASERDPNGQIRHDEFIPLLRGQRGIKKFREMRDNDAVIGAIMFALEQMLRPVEWTFEPKDDSPEASRAADIVTRGFEEMEIPFSEFIAEALSFFTYGFSLFEQVYRRDPKTGDILIKKLAPRAQWTIDSFMVNDVGEYTGAVQSTYRKRVVLPRNKTVLFRTTSMNRDPAGRSALRNAYVSYYRLNFIQEIEAIAIERELNGIPVARIPSEYLLPNASEAQKAVKNQLMEVVRDVKRNEQGYVILPSDLIQDEEGRFSTKYMVDLQLIASNGTRDIDTNKVIIRYQQDIARSVMADFVMLGVNDRGSFAMSESKSGLFLKACSGYMSTIGRTLETQLFPGWLLMNGIDPNLAPRARYGTIAPVNLEELGNYISKLSLAGAPLFPDLELENHSRRVAGLPPRPENMPLEQDDEDETDDEDDVTSEED